MSRPTHGAADEKTSRKGDLMGRDGGLPGEQIPIACVCGKRYRVSVANAGAKLTCKVCGEKVRVPRAAAVSERSRNVILAEMGIDSDVAKARYKAEKLRETPQPRVYRCVRCEGTIPASKLKGAYVRGELLCEPCRDSAQVVDRKAEAEEEEDERKGRKRASIEGGRGAHARGAALLALAFGAFFFLGIFAPFWIVFDARLVASVAMGLLIAVPGGLAVYARQRGLAYL